MEKQLRQGGESGVSGKVRHIPSFWPRRGFTAPGQPETPAPCVQAKGVASNRTGSGLQLLGHSLGHKIATPSKLLYIILPHGHSHVRS